MPVRVLDHLRAPNSKDNDNDIARGWGNADAIGSGVLHNYKRQEHFGTPTVALFIPLAKGFFMFMHLAKGFDEKGKLSPHHFPKHRD